MLTETSPLVKKVVEILKPFEQSIQSVMVRSVEVVVESPHICYSIHSHSITVSRMYDGRIDRYEVDDFLEVPGARQELKEAIVSIAKLLREPWL